MAQGDTTITVVGNVVADPELRFTPAGAAVANFRVASTPRRFNSQTNQWEDGEAMFLTCNVWRQAAENVAETLTKGMRVIVNGRLRQRSYQNRDGENRTVFEIEVDEVGPSLRYASAQVTRKSANGGNGGGNYGGGQQQNQGGNNFGGGNQGGFGGNQSAPQQSQQSAPSNDPWNSAPQAGSFGGADAEPPF
ncbi:single-stranded DNA-binding protein [Corynebacterium striatum]|uniref:Single-stranded DNA-binding protein n=1 Tax=Corynebacterium striatum TaxID=43770 RepID=A0A0M2X4S3_CORST|nr:MULTISPECIES: single-stranded DNA-binding protein [Corynebacterium]ART20371.1 single-stranded DNA-binding protein [Corynebacterium striatum]ATZ06785.1 single-stranded DNA-binding protein [Corynebacterium striatum]EEI77174.1 single-strand binding family protein [Corynebacterium striatum ATCC 6940]EGT5592282.1 single-stranded DNA-binding protein [Corynebacterium striatum]EGT5594789.1 single-stranded DNA-binding protein [Corynebacterium striatum]